MHFILQFKKKEESKQDPAIKRYNTSLKLECNNVITKKENIQSILAIF